MLRAAVVYMVRAGLTLCATAHDAIMIEAPLDRLDADVALAREIMERVSLSFTRGLLVRTEARLLRRGALPGAAGERMWRLITDLLEDGSHASRTCAPASSHLLASETDLLTSEHPGH